MSVSEIRDLNAALVEKINREALADPKSQYAGKWVGVANGKVVAVANSLDEVTKELERIEPDRARARIIEASRDYSVVEYVWETA